MAKRLNKKVALIGSAVVAVVVLGAIFLILRMSRDAQEFVRDAEVAIAEKDYKRAESSLRSAYNFAKTDELREDVLFRLVDVYIETDQWRFAQWCWQEIVRINPQNAKARYCKLMYFYILADSGVGAAVWEQVKKDADDFLKVAERAQLLRDQTSKWEIFQADIKEPVSAELGPFLYYARGRASLELTIQGRATNKDETLKEAVADLEKVINLEPGNIGAYQLLAEAEIEHGKILYARGSYTERDKIIKEAQSLLERAVEISKDNPKAQLNLLRMKLNIAKGSSQAEEEIKSLATDYEALGRKYPSNDNVVGEIAAYYADLSSVEGPETAPKYLDESIKAIEKTISLNSNSVEHIASAANLYYRKYSLYGGSDNINKAVELAKLGLTLPDTQDTEGPRKYANLMAKYGLHSFLAHCSVEQIVDTPGLSEAEKKKWLLEAETAVHAIEQIQKGDDNPQVIQWRGMLNLAKGNRKTAVRQLYMAYERLKALKPSTPPWPVDLRFGYLCHRLGKIFKDSSEDGAVLEFLTNGLNSYVAMMKPEARLDYAEVSLKFNRWTAARENINVYEKRFGINKRSTILRVRSDIGEGRFDIASNTLSGMDQNDPNTVKLGLELILAKIKQLQLALVQKNRQDNLNVILGTEKGEVEGVDKDATTDAMMADLKNMQRAASTLVEKLVEMKSDLVASSDVTGICKFYVSEEQIDKANSLLGRFIASTSDNTGALLYQATLSEPDPSDILDKRKKEIWYKALSDISDPARRALQLGIFYRSEEELEKAAAEFQKVLDMPVTVTANPEVLIFEQPEDVRVRRTAAGYLFDIAMKQQDFNKAEQIIKIVKSENLDTCDGQVFAARLAMAKEDFQDALTRIDDCLKQRPVFSQAYMLRSNINSALGKDEVTILQDMRRAASFNPLNGVIAKGLADVLFRRNMKLGDNVTSTQIVEARKALEVAISLNPRDIELLDLYASFVSKDEPMRAIAILQDILKTSPDMVHALRLGKLATDVAKEQNDVKLRTVLFDVAGAALEQARQMDATNEIMLQLYADYYRAKGEDRKAEELLTSAKEDRLLWNHYLQRGQYEEAKDILDKMYQADPKDRNVVGGLLIISEKIGDQEGVKKYTSELIALDKSNVDSYLIEIQSYLKSGLVQEAERKLESFTEKFPDEPRTLLLSSWLAMRKGQLKKAVELANRNLEIDQDNAAAWRLRGEIYFFMADYSQAVSDLMRSKALVDDPATRMSLSKAYVEQGRYEDAITELKNTINAPGSPPEARTFLEHIYTRLGRKDALSKLYDETLERFPNSVQWLNNAGSFAVGIGDYDKAENLYSKACKLRQDFHKEQGSKNLVQDPLYLSAFDGYLRSLVAGAGTKGSGNWNPQKLDTVFEEGRKYIDTDFAPIVYFRMAQAKDRLGDRETTIDYCRRAVDAAENNESVASEILLRMYLLLGPEEVAKYCQEKLSENPDSLPAHYTMFNLYKMSGQFNKAVESADKCIQLTKDNPQRQINFRIKKAEVLTLAYNKSSDKQYLSQAISEYESLLEKMPNNTSVLNNLAYMLADNNERLPKALSYAQKVVGLKPNDPSVLDTYAYVLHKNGRNPEASEKLLAALQQYEQNNAVAPPDIYEHIGMVKEAMGAKLEAIVAYKKALEIGSQVLSDVAKSRLTKAVERLSR